MRKRLVDIVLIIICVVAFITILTGCGYEETKEYELLTVRRYAEVEESGTFTTKENTDWHIEFTYKTEEGIQKSRFHESSDFRWEISEKNKVVLEKGKTYPMLHITLEKYKELYGIEEEGWIE